MSPRGENSQDPEDQKLAIRGHRGGGDLVGQMIRLSAQAYARNFLIQAAYKRRMPKAFCPTSELDGLKRGIPLQATTKLRTATDSTRMKNCAHSMTGIPQCAHKQKAGMWIGFGSHGSNSENRGGIGKTP